MIAVDTNILIYAHREDSPWFAAASERMTELAEGKIAGAIPWPCIHEFFAIVTHPKIYNPPTPRDAAIGQIEAWLESPSLVLLSESEGYWEELKPALEKAQIVGPQVHDTRVVALCRLHGVKELWSADRDFSRYPGLKTRNPLV